jgi:phosphoribulokinase
VRLIQRNGNKLFDPAFLYDKGSKITWEPDAGKLAIGAEVLKVSSGGPPGLKMESYSAYYYNNECTVLEMTGEVSRLDDVRYIEEQLSDAGTKSDGEMTDQMFKHESFPGSMNGTGLFQTVVGLKIREVYERCAQ